MKFKRYQQLIADLNGFIPTPRFRWVIRKNERSTAREEAILGEVQRQANPRENITGHYPWGPEEQMVLQQLWIHQEKETATWKDVLIEGAEELYSTEQTESGEEFPVPNAIKEPGMIKGDFPAKLGEMLGRKGTDEAT